MLTFHSIYRPLTSRPFLSDNTYMEYQPRESLRPYIACYWMMGNDTTDGGGERNRRGILVTPDTCMDVIVRVNHTRQTMNGYLCGIQDQPFLSSQNVNGGDVVTSFAIRFYFWSAHLFLDVDFEEARNRFVNLEDMGGGWRRLFEPFFYLTNIGDRIAWVEPFLMKRLAGKTDSAFFNSIEQILTSRGRLSVKELCAYNCVSQRQMERLFSQKVGLPLKRVSSLVRYQNVWREVALSEKFDVHDAVYSFGYTDQAHLLKEFKRFHGVSPGEARRIAEANR